MKSPEAYKGKPGRPPNAAKLRNRPELGLCPNGECHLARAAADECRNCLRLVANAGIPPNPSETPEVHNTS
jgi:hypothetical protein